MEPSRGEQAPPKEQLKEERRQTRRWTGRGKVVAKSQASPPLGLPATAALSS